MSEHSRTSDEDLLRARRRLLKIAIYVPPAIVASMALASPAHAFTCNPGTCMPPQGCPPAGQCMPGPPCMPI